MCGIAGILTADGQPVLASQLQAMCDVMVHRGPDDAGFYLGGVNRLAVGLGMRRLSIIDLKTGQQPTHNEDGTIWAVQNGEIYNYRQLRRQLEQNGHLFTSASDTEVLVHLYEEHGDCFVDLLRGMFAIALWDARKARLLLVRDRLGIKPLYYTVKENRLAFASELKALLQLPEVVRRLNMQSLNHYLSFLTTPHDESIIAGVHKLEPGHLLRTTSGGGGLRIQPHAYWNVQFKPEYGRSRSETLEQLRALLEESILLHRVSDRPLGAFLSGGIDSSSVVATLARASTRPVKTFSIGFTDRNFNELEYARSVARRFETEHHELILEPNAIDVIEELIWYADEPFGDSSAIPTYFVSRLAAQEVTVVLSGDGGDELFAGYDKYVVESRERWLERIARPGRGLAFALARRLTPGARGRNFLWHFSLQGAQRYLDASTLFRHDDKRRILQPDLFAQLDAGDVSSKSLQWLTGPHWLSSLQYLDVKTYLPLDILTKVDRMSMAHSLEARVPLLDHRLVEFAATIPPAWHLHHGTTKYMLKRAMRHILPDDVIHRPKQGFAIPLGTWFRGEFADFVRDLLLSSRSRSRGILQPAGISQLLALHAGGRNLDLELWTLIALELWCRTFLDKGRRSQATTLPQVAGQPSAGIARNVPQRSPHVALSTS